MQFDNRRDDHLPRWVATELELIELVLVPDPAPKGPLELKSLRGLEASVACVLDPDSCEPESARPDRLLAA